MFRVALIFPYFRTKSLNEILFPPLGAATLAAQLRRRGIETRIFDCTFSSLERLQKDLAAYQPDIVGIYSMITLSRNTFQVAEMVREILPESILAAGGPLPTLYPERFLSHFAAVFRGEADLSFPAFCQDLNAPGAARLKIHDLPLESYEGLFLQDSHLKIDNPPVHYREVELHEFPLPDRRDFDHQAYQEIWLRKDGTKTTSIMTTLGCPYSCDFCSRPVFGSSFRRRDLDAVFAEIEQIRSLGYDSVWIADDNFTLNHAHLEEFCQRMLGKDISWSCLSRVSGIDGAVARMMKEAGCKKVYLGLETGSQATLQLMNKKATVEEGIEAVFQFRNAGIEAAAFFIVGYPGETTVAIEATFKLALSLPLNEISFNVPYPLPGSKLFERVSGVAANKDWNEENETTFLYSSEFDEAWLRQRIGETMQAFAAQKR